MIHGIFSLYVERWPFFQELILQHIKIASTAILISGTIGLFLGILISEHRKFATWIIGIINVAYTIPSISMLGFLIPFTGIGNKTATIALTIYGLLPMVRNTYTGITTIEGHGKHALADSLQGQASAGASCHRSGTPQYGSYDDFTQRYRLLHRGRRLRSGHLPRHHHEQRRHDVCRQYLNRHRGTGLRSAGGLY